MFGSSYAEFVQGSAVKTWDCVAHFASLLWYKFIHLKDPIMPRSRRRHHSRSRSRSRSHSHDRDREPKRRKIESYDSPHHRRSVSSKPEAIDCETDDHGIDEHDVQKENIISNNAIEKSSEKLHSNNIKTSEEDDKSSPVQDVRSNSDMKEDNDQLLEDHDIQNSKSSSDASNEDILESEKLLSSNNKDNSVCELIESTESNEEESKGSEHKSSENRESDKKESDEDPNEPAIEEAQVVDISNEETLKNNTSGTLKEKAKDLNITPKKVISPKQLQKRLESEKKRLEKQKEKEERDRAKLEEKKKITEEKLRIKQEREEQKSKEKMAKDDKKKKEQEERDKKRREKEEKDEQKKKEREQEKLKKQQEMEEKNKEKQKLEEQKQKTAAAFVNFFVAKKSDSTEERKTEESSNFMPFEVKSDMRLAPVSRKYLEGVKKMEFEKILENPDSNTRLYLDELKQGKVVGKFGKTWRFEDIDPDDVIVVDENVGETIVEQKPKVEKMRAKFFKFSENQRPPYFGTFKKRSKIVTARRPLGKDSIFNYEIDSDEEWDEEGEGESLKGTDDEDEKDNESDNDYEVDNDVFVPHGHLSGDERDDEENAKFSPESHKAKLKLLKNEFDEEMKSKLQRIKPRVIGCIWYDKTKSNVEEAIDKYLQPFAIVCNGQIQIKKRSEFALASHKKVPKQLSKEHVPTFLKFIHGSVDRKKNIVKYFTEHMSNNGIQLDVSGYGLVKQMKKFAQWQKCPEEGAMHKKMCWYVDEDIRKEYNVNLVLPNKMNRKRR